MRLKSVGLTLAAHAWLSSIVFQPDLSVLTSPVSHLPLLSLVNYLMVCLFLPLLVLFLVFGCLISWVWIFLLWIIPLWIILFLDYHLTEFHIIGFIVWIIAVGNSLLIIMRSLLTSWKLVPKLIKFFILFRALFKCPAEAQKRASTNCC